MLISNPMRKTLTMLIITVTVMLSAFVKAQIINSYLDSTSTWYELFGGSNGITIYKDYNKYFFDGTIVSGKNYYKLYWNQIDSVWDAFTQNFMTVNYYNHIYQGGFKRRFTKKVLSYVSIANC
jgi:hypothetical protein